MSRHFVKIRYVSSSHPSVRSYSQRDIMENKHESKTLYRGIHLAWSANGVLSTSDGGYQCHSA